MDEEASSDSDIDSCKTPPWSELIIWSDEEWPLSDASDDDVIFLGEVTSSNDIEAKFSTYSNASSFQHSDESSKPATDETDNLDHIEVVLCDVSPSDLVHHDSSGDFIHLLPVATGLQMKGPLSLLPELVKKSLTNATYDIKRRNNAASQESVDCTIVFHDHDYTDKYSEKVIEDIAANSPSFGQNEIRKISVVKPRRIQIDSD